MVRLTGQRQRATWGRVLLACATALLIGASTSSTALASRPGYDRSFGEHGRVSLTPPKPAGVRRLKYREWLGTSGGDVYVLAGSECRKCSRSSDFLFKFGRGGRLVRPFGGGHGFVRLPDGESVDHLAVDARGRPLLTSREDGIEVRRYTRGGRPDPRFGHRGVVRLPRLNRAPEAEGATVTQVPGGGLLVSSETFSENHGFARFHLEELREDGTPDRGFGHRGVTAVDAAGEFHLEGGPTVTPDGSILIGSECCSATVSLTRVSARGRLDTRFDRAVRRTLRPLTALSYKHPESSELFSIVPRADGGVDLFGRIWPRGFELRIKGDGRPDTRFAGNGLKILRLPVSAAVPLPGGGFFATGLEFNEPTIAMVLRGDGTLDHRFPLTSLGPGSEGAVPTLLGGGRANVAYGRPIGADEDFQERPLVARFVLPAGRG